MDEINRLYAIEFLLRVFTAVLFIGMGYDKLFHVKLSGVVRTFQSDAENRNVSRHVLWLFALITSCLELIFGLTLILGLFRQMSLFVLGIDLLLISSAFTYMKPIWDMRQIVFRMVFILLLLLMPIKWAGYCLDVFL